MIAGDTPEIAGKRIRPSTAADGIFNLTHLRAHSTGSATGRLRIFNGLDPKGRRLKIAVT